MRLGIGLGLFKAGLISAGVRIFSSFQTRVIGDGGTVESGTCVVNGINSSALLQQASLLLIPSGYKGGKLYAEIPTNGNGDLTWTRGGDAFRTNASGVLQRVPWNLLQQSQNFADTSWVTLNSTRVSTTQTDPSGYNTALNLTWASGGSKYFYRTQTGLTVGTTYTLSFYVKSSNSSKFRIYSESLGFTTSNLTSTSDFARYTLTFTATVTSGTIGLQAASDNTAADLIVAFAQLVEGTTAQTYLPTTDRLNFPRLSYMYGSCPSALLEPQRTNLVLQSQDFDNASWTKTASSVTANTTTSPDGNSNADTFTANGVSTFHIIEQSFNITNGTNYAFSVYAKKNTNNFLQIIGGSSNFGLNAWANFDLNNGVVGSVGSSATASIVNVGNGWYRCVMVAQGTATLAGTSAFGIISSSTAGRGEINTLSTSVFLWGAQLEAGAYPTTYIPTTSATATRVADSFSRSNIYTNGLISASGGTWFVSLVNNVAYTRDATTRLGIGDTTALTTNSIQFGISSGGSFRLQIVTFVGGSGNTIYTTTTDTVKIAIKWNGTSADIFANGTKVVSATSFTPTNMENFVTNGIGVPFFIQQMALFPTPLTDTQCQTLTT